MDIQPQAVSTTTPPPNFLWFSSLFTKHQQDTASQNLCDSVRQHPERETQIWGDSSATCCLLLLIKMSELFVSLHCNLLVWRATKTISSCHQIIKAPISNGRTGAFWYLKRKTKQKKETEMQKHLHYYCFQSVRGKRYHHSLYAHS